MSKDPRELSKEELQNIAEFPDVNDCAHLLGHISWQNERIEQLERDASMLLEVRQGSVVGYAD